MNIKPQYEEIKIVTLGNVSAGKSTMIGVLTQDILDDGRGLARKNICRYPHEVENGKTSAIGHHYIVYKENYEVYKSITMIDLAGHEKYLKTTLKGINSTLCDYVMLLIGSNMGVSRMTREHFNIAKALNKPIFIVITKLDICPKPILEKTINEIKEILSSEFAGSKKPWIINSLKDAEQCSKIISTKQEIYPIFKVSSVSGENIPLLKSFIKNIHSPTKWDKFNNDEPEFLIDDRFHIAGIGLVVSGTMQKGQISIGDKLWLGPFNNKFKQVIIKSIHGNIKNPITNISAGYTSSFAIKPINKKDSIKRNNIKNGMVILSNPYCVSEFKAKVLILHHPTTIRIGYQSVIHCGNVRQSAKIIDMDKELTRTGDTTIVTFRFSFHSEYLQIGSKIMFREGRTKGVGDIVEIFE